MNDPAFHRQALVGHIAGIHITESVEESHDATGAEHQAEQDTDGEQAFVRLVHDAVDSLRHIVKRSRGDEEVLDQHHHPFIEKRYRDVGNQREEEQQQGEEGHEEIERHACGTVDSAAFGEELDEVGDHVQERQFGTRETHHLQEVVVLVIPFTQRFVFSFDPHKPFRYDVQN